MSPRPNSRDAEPNRGHGAAVGDDELEKDALERAAHERRLEQTITLAIGLAAVAVGGVLLAAIATALGWL